MERERRRGGVDPVGLLRLLKIYRFFFDERGGNNSLLLYSRRGISNDQLENGLSLNECPARSSAPTSLGSLSGYHVPLDLPGTHSVPTVFLLYKFIQYFLQSLHTL